MPSEPSARVGSRKPFAEKLVYPRHGRSVFGPVAVEAGEAIGDPRLYPALMSLKSRWASDGADAKVLEAALAKCSLSKLPDSGR